MSRVMYSASARDKRSNFINTRAMGIDQLRRRAGRRKVPVHLFLAPSTRGRFRIWAQPESGPLYEAMRHSAEYVGKVQPKHSLSDIVFIVRKAIEGKDIVPCG